MSEAIAFDTHRFVKRLTETGFTEAQAEALADEQVSLLNSNLVTRQDQVQHEAKLELQIAELRAELERQIAELRADVERKLGELKADLLKWMIGALIAQGGLVVALIKLL